MISSVASRNGLGSVSGDSDSPDRVCLICEWAAYGILISRVRFSVYACPKSFSTSAVEFRGMANNTIAATPPAPTRENENGHQLERLRFSVGGGVGEEVDCVSFSASFRRTSADALGRA